jgi:hypothetical protein
MQQMNEARRQAYARELVLAAEAIQHSRPVAAWQALEYAHVLGQLELRTHARVHGLMLRYAAKQRDTREAIGQLGRLLLTPIGHMTRRLPANNPGTTRTGVFAPRPWPQGLDPDSFARTSGEFR